MIRCILFDFSKTLCSDLYFSSFSLEEQQLVSKLLFSEDKKREWANPWMIGKKDVNDILKYLALNMRYGSEQLKEILISDLKKMKMNKDLWEFAIDIKNTKGLISGILSVNTDIFNKYVIDLLELDNNFDFIINSYDYGLTNKVKLLKDYISNKDLDLNIKECLLIDDSYENIKNFIENGGVGYHYTDDNKFNDWLKNQDVVEIKELVN